MARRQRIRAVRSHAMACTVEQVSGRGRPGADRPQRSRDRFSRAWLQDSVDGFATGAVAEESRARLSWFLDESEDGQDRVVFVAGSVRGRRLADEIAL